MLISEIRTSRDVRFYYHHWYDISAGGLLDFEGVILPVVSAPGLEMFIRYIIIEISSS